MTVTTGDKITAIQSVIDGAPSWADMAAFRAILDDYQQCQFAMEALKQIMEIVATYDGIQCTCLLADIGEIARLALERRDTSPPTPAPALDAMERASALWDKLPFDAIQWHQQEVISKIATAFASARAAAIEECALVARSHQVDVSSDFDEGYDSAVADITEAILALVTQPAQLGE